MTTDKRLTPLKAHRIRCLKCHAGSYKAIRECEDNDCESYEFRFGHNPRRKGIRRNKTGLERDNKSGLFIKAGGEIKEKDIIIKGKYKLVKIDNGD